MLVVNKLRVYFLQVHRILSSSFNKIDCQVQQTTHLQRFYLWYYLSLVYTTFCHHSLPSLSLIINLVHSHQSDYCNIYKLRKLPEHRTNWNPRSCWNLCSWNIPFVKPVIVNPNTIEKVSSFFVRIAPTLLQCRAQKPLLQSSLAYYKCVFNNSICMQIYTCVYLLNLWAYF